VRHAGARHICCSAETGSGASTLLFSHMSQQHTVFALDDGSGSIENVRRSALLRQNVVTFVEGPTQRTLPSHRFSAKLQVILIDGPHGYPFPDIEYYFLYPHLDPGGLLILDDIHIHSIHNLFDFLRKDHMFRLDEVADTTAFFTRTNARSFDPLGDGWWMQAYNTRPLFRYVWKQNIKAFLPRDLRREMTRLKRRMTMRRANCAVSVLAPRAGERVGNTGKVEGCAALPPDCFLWVLVRRKGLSGWWPQGGGPVPIDRGRWMISVN
jgi:hypothetical protein